MKRVAVFYSVGPHFITALKSARTLGDSVVAIIPPHLATDDASLIDETIVTEKSHYTPRTIAANRRLIKQLHAENVDAFVILFDSPQLRLLASLINARESWYCAPHGYLTQLHGGPLRVAFAETMRRAKGWSLYARIWFHVRLHNVDRHP